MNSTKLFNKAYFIQNLKKSKGLIIFMTILIPIFTTIMLLALSSEDSVIIANLETISAINMVGLLLLPLLLSLTLFSYVFKTKSVDFINSMPISKKTIFVTNTLGGIGILFLTVLVTLLMVVIVGLSSPNIILVKEVCFDYLVYWFAAYTFVFVATNLAISVSGNAITSIAVTLLLLFFIPFFCDYTSMYYTTNVNTNLMVKCEDKECIPDYYNCYENKECLVNKGVNTYSIAAYNKENSSYNIPYELFSNIFFAYNNEVNMYNLTSIIKTLMLSIIYIVLGLYLFIHRKMEVCETSFKSFNLHLIVKGLTLMPIVFILYEIIDSSFVSILIFIALIVTYYFVFDLITRKSISHLRKSLIWLVFTVLIWSFYAYLVNDTNLFKRTSDTIRISSNDVEYVKLQNSNTGSENFDTNYYDDRDLINLVLNYSYSSEYRLDSSSSYTTLIFTLKLKDGDEYNTSILVPDTKYDEFIEKFASVSKIDEKIKEFNYEDTIALYINNEYIIDKNLISLIEDSANSITSSEYYNNLKSNKFFGDSYLYIYANNNVVKYEINGLINSEITNYIIERSNEKLQDALSIKFNNDRFYINIIYFDSVLYNNDDSAYYFVDNMSEELYNFACDYGTESFDSTKPYAVISYEYNYNGLYRLLYTNKVDELEKIYTQKRSELINTDEYKVYYQNSIKGSEEKKND